MLNEAAVFEHCGFFCTQLVSRKDARKGAKEIRDPLRLSFFSTLLADRRFALKQNHSIFTIQNSK
jgi:hypothetical protein